MSLADLVTLLKKFSWFLVLLVLIGIGAIALYIYIDNPKGEQAFGVLPAPGIQSTLANKVKVKSAVSLSGSLDRLAYVYKNEGVLNGKTLATKLGIESAPQTYQGNLYWTGVSTSLTVRKNTFTFDSVSTIGPKTITEDAAYTRATNLLSSLHLAGGDVSLEKLDTKYLIAQAYHVEPSTKANFNTYSISIGAELNGYQIVNNVGSPVLYIFDIGVDGEIKKIQGRLEKLVFSEKSTYPVKHLDAIRSDFEKGKGKIVSISDQITPDQELEIAYSSVDLAYFLPETNEAYLEPVIVAQASLGSYQTSIVTAVLPALKNSVLVND